jgi:polyisoprenoid-binding protein YceI
MAKYRLIPESSRIWAEARSSLHPIRSETNGLEGYIEAEIAEGRADLSAAPKARVQLETARVKTGNPLYDTELSRRLETRKYPRITGEVREVTALAAANRYHVKGDLSFHGVTHPVEGDVTLRIVNDTTIELEGENVIDIRKFGLEPPRLLMLKVYPDVRIRGRVLAEREN